MKYKGIELKEVTESQIFDPPKKTLVWGRCESITELDVYAIVSRKDFLVICENSTWKHCAEIPEVPESELVTYRELARWLAEGNGEAKIVKTACIHWIHGEIEADENVEDNVYVRKWEDTEWHNPTREYLGLEDK